MEQKRSNKSPVHVIRHGEVEAAIWKNVKDGRTSYAVSFTRPFTKEGGGRYHVRSFGHWQLADLARCAFDAEFWLGRHGVTRDVLHDLRLDDDAVVPSEVSA